MKNIFSRYHLHTCLVTLFLLSFSGNIIGQNDLGLFQMSDVPQSANTNPAVMYNSKYWFGIPALSSVNFSYGNSGFKYVNLVKRRLDDSTYLDIQGFTDVLKNRNFLSLNVNENILSGGYMYDRFYFTGGINERASFQYSFPSQFISFFVNGNAEFIDKTVNFDKMRVKAMHFREYYIGAATKLNDKWTVGAKAKLLFGKMNIYTKRLEGSVYTHPQTFYLTTSNNVLVNTSIPDEIAYDSIDFQFGKYFWSGQNPGFAFDLGGIYKYDDKLTFAASILDLGTIRWKNDVKNYKSENVTWTFQGIDINDYIGEEDSVVEARLDNLADSLEDKFGINKTHNKYWCPLSSKLYLMAFYRLNGFETVSASIRSEFFNKTLHPSLTVGYQRKVLPWLYASGTYSVIHRNFGNLGLGVVANGGPFQFYFSTDNVFGLMVPAQVKLVHFNMGMNIIFREPAQVAPKMR